MEESSKELSIALKSESGPVGLLGDVGPSIHQTIQELSPKALDDEFQIAYLKQMEEHTLNAAKNSW